MYIATILQALRPFHNKTIQQSFTCFSNIHIPYSDSCNYSPSKMPLITSFHLFLSIYSSRLHAETPTKARRYGLWWLDVWKILFPILQWPVRLCAGFVCFFCLGMRSEWSLATTWQLARLRRYWLWNSFAQYVHCYRVIHADVIVYILLSSIATLRTGGNMLDTNWLRWLKTLWNLPHGEIFSSLGCNIQGDIVFQNCKISGWQKR